MSDYDYTGATDMICTTIQCRFGRKPKATHFNTFTGKWLCFPCSQKVNAGNLQMGVTKKACISGDEYLIQLLSKVE